MLSFCRGHLVLSNFQCLLHVIHGVKHWFYCYSIISMITLRARHGLLQDDKLLALDFETILSLPGQLNYM